MATKTTSKRRLHSYNDETLENALQDVRNEETIRAKCRKYGVPRTTLQGRLKGRALKSKMGPDPVVVLKNEKKI